jgi:hypothetical protein
MSQFNKERAILLEGTLVYHHPKVNEQPVQDYHLEVVSVQIEPKRQEKPAKTTGNKPVKKAAVKRGAAKKTRNTLKKSPVA